MIPVICHAISLAELPLQPDWQTGKLSDQLYYVLAGRLGFVLYPLMSYAMVSLGFVIAHEARFSQRSMIRFGIYSGVPIAAFYTAVLGTRFAAVDHFQGVAWLNLAPLVIVSALLPGLIWVFAELMTRISYRANVAGIRPPVVVGTSLFLIILTLPFCNVLSVVAIPFLLFGPFISFWIYAGLSWHLLVHHRRPFRFRIADMLGVFAWMAAFLGACRYAVVRSLEEYAKLPVKPVDDCYIATAAAHGHPGFVGSHDVQCRDGSTRRVNRQLAVLKSSELALAVLAPRVHRAARFVYNRVGPCLARRIRYPLMADIAWVTLKPLEWSCDLGLRLILGATRRPERPSCVGCVK